jgi:hypothetical protein
MVLLSVKRDKGLTAIASSSFMNMALFLQDKCHPVEFSLEKLTG